MKVKFNLILIPLITLVVIVLLVLILSDTPAASLYFFFAGPFSSVLRFGNMLNASTPLIFGALGVTIAMKAGSLNLGGEGQVYLGAFVTTAAALVFKEASIAAGVTAAAAVAAGVLASGAIAAFCGFCKAKWKVNELITTFLLSCAIIPIVNFLISGPFQDPQVSLQSTKKIAENMRLSLILRPSNLNTGIFLALIASLIVWFVLAKTKFGYELRMAGSNEMFARYGGINTKLNTVLVMALSGGLYGLAGSIAVLGTHYAAIREFSSGFGWNGLAVALIASFNPIAVIPAAVFIAWINAGARIAMQNTGITFEVASIVQAVIFFLASSIALKNIYTKRERT